MYIINGKIAWLMSIKTNAPPRLSAGQCSVTSPKFLESPEARKKRAILARSVVNGQVVDFLGTRYVLYGPRECRIKRREKLISAKLQEAGARSAAFFRDSIPFIRGERASYTCLGYIYALVTVRVVARVGDAGYIPAFNACLTRLKCV